MGFADYPKIKKAINEYLFEKRKIKEKYIISSRIDNDDAFHKNIVNEFNLYLIIKMIYLLILIMVYNLI